MIRTVAVLALLVLAATAIVTASAAQLKFTDEPVSQVWAADVPPPPSPPPGFADQAAAFAAPATTDAVDPRTIPTATPSTVPTGTEEPNPAEPTETASKPATDSPTPEPACERSKHGRESSLPDELIALLLGGGSASAPDVPGTACSVE